MNNTFKVIGDLSAQKIFAESSLKTCDIVLGHYTFVIQDISSEITNLELEKSKGPVLEFLKAMKYEWESFRNNIQLDLDKIIKTINDKGM